jgi:uncharacterized protein YjbI with pentapeptide repeats
MWPLAEICTVANREHVEWLHDGVNAWNMRWRELLCEEGSKADLSEANLVGAQLSGAILTGADLSGADLSDADLQKASFVGTDLRGANLSGCRVYGTSAWDILVDEQTKQANLVITPDDQPNVSVDNLKVAQFVYLLLTNPEIRGVIDILTTKIVLILGRFTDERKAVLDALRDALRLRGYAPILFDFEKPASRDLTETVSILAHLARFVVADLTDAKSLPQELSRIVPNLPSVAIQPLILEGQREYAMFEYFARFPWVLPPYTYTDQSALLAGLVEHVITPAETKAEDVAPAHRKAG